MDSQVKNQEQQKPIENQDDSQNQVQTNELFQELKKFCEKYKEEKEFRDIDIKQPEYKAFFQEYLGLSKKFNGFQKQNKKNLDHNQNMIYENFKIVQRLANLSYKKKTIVKDISCILDQDDKFLENLQKQKTQQNSYQDNFKQENQIDEMNKKIMIEDTETIKDQAKIQNLVCIIDKFQKQELKEDEKYLINNILSIAYQKQNLLKQEDDLNLTIHDQKKLDENLQQQQKVIQELNKEIEKIGNLQQEINSLKQKNLGLEKQVKETKNSQQEFQQQNQKLLKKINNHEQSEQEQKKKLELKEQENIQLNSYKEKAEKELGELRNSKKEMESYQNQYKIISEKLTLVQGELNKEKEQVIYYQKEHTKQGQLLKKKNDDFDSLVKTSQGDIKNLQENLEQSNQQVGQKQKEIMDLQVRISGLEKKIQDMKVQQQEQEQYQEEQKEIQIAQQPYKKQKTGNNDKIGNGVIKITEQVARSTLNLYNGLIKSMAKDEQQMKNAYGKLVEYEIQVRNEINSQNQVQSEEETKNVYQEKIQKKFRELMKPFPQIQLQQQQQQQNYFLPRVLKDRKLKNPELKISYSINKLNSQKYRQFMEGRNIVQSVNDFQQQTVKNNFFSSLQDKIKGCDFYFGGFVNFEVDQQHPENQYRQYLKDFGRQEVQGNPQYLYQLYQEFRIFLISMDKHKNDEKLKEIIREVGYGQGDYNENDKNQFFVLSYYKSNRN